MKSPSLSILSALFFGSVIVASGDTLIELPFNEAPGDDLLFHDTSGNGRDVRFNGSVEQTADHPFETTKPDSSNRSILNAGGNLGGFGGDVVNASTIRLDTNNAFTIEAWVKWQGNAGGLCRVTGPHLMIWLAWDTTGQIYLTYGEGTIISTGVRIAPHQWTHLAYAFGDGQFTLYLDGQEQVTGEASAADVAALSGSISTIHLLEADGALNGSADDFRLSDRALKTSELGFHHPLGGTTR